MAKDMTFKLRLDAQDRARLEAVAEHYSAPAATAIRMLIKEKHDTLPLKLPAFVESRAGTFMPVAEGQISRDEKGQVVLSLRGKTYHLEAGTRPAGYEPGANDDQAWVPKKTSKKSE